MTTGSPRRTLGFTLGFTLTELLTVVAIAAILLAVAVPSFQPLFARWQLEGVANELHADLQFARSQAVSDNTTVTFTTTSTSAYTITGNQTYKTVTLPAGVSVSSGVAVAFLPQRGCTNATCSAADADFAVSGTGVNGTLQAVVNNMGRVRLCAPSGTFRGYPAC
jgi:prepilin-type N-terminal cleavage/methylation domain-containing protein